MALGGKDVLRLVVDADSSGAIREFDKLGKQVKSTVGDVEKSATGLKGKLGSAFDGLAQKSPIVSSALSKMGISGQQAGAMIASAIPMAAVAAGGAIAAFAAKGVGDFQRIALAAGKFSDASGLSVEQASKWIEVADHIGVSETAVSSAFRRMGVAIGNNTAGWQALGVEVVKNRDGSLNLSDTFLKVVTSLQAIEDPTKRAAAAQKLFGKGYAEVAELIGRSAPELADMLNEVGDAKIITPEELEKARAFRGAMDDLSDSVQEAGIMLGQQLVPQLTKLAAFATTGINIAVEVSGLDVGAGFTAGDIASEAITAINPMQRLTNVVSDLFDRYRGGKGAVDAVTESVTVLGGGMAQMSKQAGDVGIVLGSRFAEMSKNAEKARESNFRFGGSADAVAENVGDEASALRDANDALTEHSNQLRSAYDSAFAFAEAERQQAEATLAATAASVDDNLSAGEKRKTYDELEKQTMETADALVKYTKDQAVSSGATFTAADENKLFATTLRQLAQDQIPEIRNELLIMASNFDTLDAKDAKPTATLNDQATPKITNARATLVAFGNMSVEAAARVTADTSAADRALQGFLSRVRNSNGMVIIGGLTRGSGGPIPGNRNQPVPVMAHGGEYVLSADVVDRIKQGGPSKGALGPGGMSVAGGGGGTTVNFNGTFLGSRAEFGRIVDEALAESRRRGNRAA